MTRSHGDSTGRLNLGDHETGLRSWGTDPEHLILVHGIGFDGVMWSQVGPAIAGRTAVAYDLRGHGAAASAPEPFTYERFAEDLARVLDGLGVERAHIAGLSLGGQVALEFALRYPDRLSSLVLICTRASPFPAFSAAAEQAEAQGLASLAETALQRWFSPTALVEDTPAVAYARDRLASIDSSVWSACMRLIAGFDVIDRLGEVSAPTRVLAAELDSVASPDHMEEIAAQIPHADFLVIPGARHLVCFEQSNAVARALSSYKHFR